MKTKSPRLAILSFMGMGDMLMALRALGSYEYEMGKIVWVCKSDSTEIVNSSFPRSPKAVIDKWKLGVPVLNIAYSAWLIARLAIFMFRNRCDRAAILDYKLRPVLVFVFACRLAGVKTVAACVDSANMRPLLSLSFDMARYKNLHEVDRYSDLFGSVRLRKLISVSALDALSLSGLGRRVRQVQSKTQESPLVLVAPGSFRPFKCWDYRKFCAIIQRLLKANVKVALVGGIEDSELAERILLTVGDHSIRDLCGKIGVLDLASLMEHADLLITNDSAPMHLADLVGLQVVALFGITRPERCGPYTQPGSVIRSGHWQAGSYSFGKLEGFDATCINQIEIEQVWATVISKIGLGR